MGETPSLRSIAEHADRLVEQSLTHEGRDYHAITTCLTRPHGVKQPYDGHWQVLLGKVSQRKEFIDGFRFSVAPSRLARWSHDPIIIFPKGGPCAFALDFRC